MQVASRPGFMTREGSLHVPKGEDGRGVPGAEDTAAQSLAQLNVQLEHANRIYLADQLDGASKALEAVLQYLNVIGVKQRMPLVHLLAALGDLSDGRSSEG